MTSRKVNAMYAEYGISPCGRCGDCCNFVCQQDYSGNFYKCAAYGINHSQTTDWCAKYQACGLFGQPFDQLSPKRKPLIKTISRGGMGKNSGPVEGVKAP